MTHKSKMSRRSFLRHASTGAIGIAIGAGTMGARFEQAFAQIRQPKVVEVRSDNVWEGEALNADIVRSMMEKACNR